MMAVRLALAIPLAVVPRRTSPPIESSRPAVRPPVARLFDGIAHNDFERDTGCTN